jgi:predicted acyltransferase
MNQRFYSLDVFRGATVALMILVNNPGSWDHIYAPLEHASWHGCTPTDLVFPFFLFAVGNAMAFVMPRLEAAGNEVFIKKILKRTLLIFAIGLFLNWAPFVKWQGTELVFKYWVDPQNPVNGIRILGVLQRIAICYCLASLIVYFFKIRGAFVISAVLLLAYWLLCLLLGNASDPFSITGYFGRDMDMTILHKSHMLALDKIDGKIYHFDYEGITSTIGAVVQVIFGYFIGHYILQKGKTFEMISNLFVTAGVLIFAGFCWNMVFPINKKIWTSSYVLYTTGLAVFILCILMHIIEFWNWKGAWSRFFDVFGKNPLFIFVLSGFLPRVLALLRWTDQVGTDGKPVYTSPLPWWYEHVCKPVSGNLKNGSLLYALCMIAFYWLIVYAMDKKKWYVKV